MTGCVPLKSTATPRAPMLVRLVNAYVMAHAPPLKSQRWMPPPPLSVSSARHAVVALALSANAYGLALDPALRNTAALVAGVFGVPGIFQMPGVILAVLK